MLTVRLMLTLLSLAFHPCHSITPEDFYWFWLTLSPVLVYWASCCPLACVLPFPFVSDEDFLRLFGLSIRLAYTRYVTFRCFSPLFSE